MSGAPAVLRPRQGRGAPPITTWEALQECQARLSNPPTRAWVLRGQSSASWRLRTTLERAVHIRFGHPYERLRWFEEHLVREFQRHFHRFSRTAFDPGDTLRWLALMRHHGAPTRLLDWSYSFYIALYFAAEQASPGDAGALWAVDDEWCRDRAAAMLPRAIRERLERDPHDTAVIGELLARNTPTVIPLNPFGQDERLAVQQGVFVVPLDLRLPFMGNLVALARGDERREHVRKIRIQWSTELLTRTLFELHRMNINRRTLFPGLDGLAAGLESMIAMPQIFR